MRTSTDASLLKYSGFCMSPTTGPMEKSHLLQILPLCGALSQMIEHLIFHGRFGMSSHTDRYIVAMCTTLYRATDLGVASWRADALGELEVVPIDSLSGHFVLAPIQVTQHEVIFDFWITIAYDHVCALPFFIHNGALIDISNRATQRLTSILTLTMIDTY
jgi:hypothetical protein